MKKTDKKVVDPSASQNIKEKFGIVEKLCIDYKYYSAFLLLLIFLGCDVLYFTHPELKGELFVVMAICFTLGGIMHYVNKNYEKYLNREIRRKAQLNIQNQQM